MPRKRDPFAELAPEPELEEAEVETVDPTPEEPPPVLGIGVHPGIAEHHYHADPCERPSLSASLAKTICERSPAHAYDEHPRLGGRGGKRQTKAMGFGTLVDQLLFGGSIEIVEISADSWKKKADQQARDAALALGQLPVLSRELERAYVLRDRILREYPLPEGGRAQLTIVWEQPVHTDTLHAGEVLPDPVLCRGRPDHLWVAEDAARAVITDLKVWASAELDALERALPDNGADIQAEAYSNALDILVPTLQGRIDFVDLVVEAETGYVNPCLYGGSMAELGRLRWQRAVRAFAHGRDTNHWPAYRVPGSFSHPQAKPWALQREQERSYGI